MVYIPILLLLSIIFLCFLPLILPKPKNTPEKPTSEYDSEGYNRQGYNEVGKNRQGKYNRYYNVKCYKTDLYSEEGFLDIRENPLYLTHHACERMYERMGISDVDRIEELAFEAYRFGKSKLKLLATDGMLVKRPLLIGDDFVLVGFKEAEWEKIK